MENVKQSETEYVQVEKEYLETLEQMVKDMGEQLREHITEEKAQCQ